jgi:tetratricopeptide (TPR) repeat protein
VAKYKLQGGDEIPTLQLKDPIGERLPDLDLGIGKADGDYLDQLDELSKSMDRGDTIATTQSAIIDLDDLLGKVETLKEPLEEARRLIGEGMHREALEQLRGLLTSPSEPHEAVYLMGLCHYHLGEPEEALAVLQPLQKATLDAGVAKPLKQLKQQVREKIMALVVLENLLLVRQGKPEKPIERLRRLTSLDPQFGLFHFLLAGNLMTADRTEEALDAAETGLRECDPDGRKQLEGLREEILRRLAEVKMDKARTHYRHGKYAKARSALQSLDTRYQESRLWITFYKYLEELGGGVLRKGKKPHEVKPTGTFKDVDALHFFLVRAEIAKAKLAISVGMFAPALGVLELALSYAPHFPYIHFLTGLCLYRSTGEAMESDNPPGPDDVIANLKTALNHAREGAKDKEIGSAKDLQSAIKGAIETMSSIKKELDVRRREAQKVNGVIEDYQAVMELVGDGISSPEQWREICTGMGKVKKKIGSVSDKVTGPEGKEALRHLEGVVDNNLKQLEALEPKIKEAESIKELMDEFAGIMQSAEGGISRDDAKRIQSRLAKLRTRVKALKKSAKGDAKEALVQLEEAIDRNHSQIKEMLSRPPEIPRDVQEFNELAQEFQSLMASAQSSPITSQSELLELMQKLASLSSRADSLKGRMKDKQGKEAAAQLIEAIGNVFQQLVPK